MSEILKEARQIILFVLVLCVLWFLTGGALRTTLITRNIIEDLGVWVLLNDALSKAGAEDQEDSFRETKIGDTLEEITALIPAQSGTEVPQKKRLTVSPPWQPGAVIPFKLKRLAAPEGSILFELISPDQRIMQARYLIAILDRGLELFSFPQAMPNSLRDLYNFIYRDGYGGPNARETVLNILWSRGWQGKIYKDLKSTDPTISSLIREIREQKYTIASLPVSPSLYPTAVSFLFLISAFNLLGPILRMKGRKIDLSNEVWIMAVNYPGKNDYLLKSAQVFVALIAAAIPLWVTIDQYHLIRLLDAPERIYWWIASPGGPLISFMICVFSFMLFRARNNPSKRIDDATS
jgi:hypothetical protein